MSEPTAEDLALVKAAHQLAVGSGMSTEVAMHALTEAMDIRELRTELARLKIRLLDGQDLAAILSRGEWSTVRGWMNGDRFQTYTSSAEGFLPPTGPTHQQRIWTGPVEPIDQATP